MTNRQKKKAWNHLRRFKPIIKRVIRGELSLQSLVIFTRIINIRLKFRINFKRMKDTAKTNKQLRQAYRYAIAAGIYRQRTGQFTKKYRRAITGPEWLAKNMRNVNG